MTRVASGLLILLVVLGAAACGGTSGAGDLRLTTRLDAVDVAAVADDPEQLESAVGSLLRAVDAAETAGDVTAAHAERIRAAAEALLEASAPADRRSPRQPTTSTSPLPDEGEEEDEHDDDTSRSSRGGDADKGKSQGEGKGKAKGRDSEDDD